MEASLQDPRLKLSFDPLTIEHLGFKMYSRLPNAIAELIANSYDADATRVDVIVDTAGTQSVRVTDDGHGMSPDDLAEKYLRIGRNRRVEDAGRSESGRRMVAGRKGLGKLALFGIGNCITIRTKRKGAPKWSLVTMDWDALHQSAGGEYFPDTRSEQADDAQAHGTEILVEELKRKTPVDAQELAVSLSQLFNYVDNDFSVSVSPPEGNPIGVTRDLRYGSIEEESRWEIPADVPVADKSPEIRGVAQRVLSQGLWQGFRSPIAHEIVEELENHAVFSYQDCLDALSILSHLRRRLEMAATPEDQTGSAPAGVSN